MRDADEEKGDESDESGDEDDQVLGQETGVDPSSSWASLALAGDDHDVEELGDEFETKNFLTDKERELPYQKEAEEAMETDQK